MDVPLLSLGLKMLVFYGYHSTDFEVHRNWLSITTSLPIKDWYFEDTSEWTLDYPPLFAYFQYILGAIAINVQWLLDIVSIHDVVDLRMLKVENLNYSSKATVFYLRLTVLVTEFVFLGYAVYKYSSTVKNPQFLYVSYFLHPGLFLVDHIHFQYNGFLYGILLLSCYYIKKNKLVIGGSLFLILVLLKHIYLYIAVGYFFYYLQLLKQPRQLIALLTSFSLILFVTFYPFSHQMQQMLFRLFPFKRGLLHALWAPNIWALYAFTDRILVKYFNLLIPSFTRGIVGDTNFAVLPDISPSTTVIITLLFYSYFTYKFIVKYNYFSFQIYLQQLAMTSFMFGWHVHEKALLLPALLNIMEFTPNSYSFVLLTTSITSQLPLIFQQKDIFIHLLIVVILVKLPEIFKMLNMKTGSYKRFDLLCWMQALLVVVCLFLKQQKEYPFLHIMLMSITNGLLNLYVFIRMILSK